MVVGVNNIKWTYHAKKQLFSRLCLDPLQIESVGVEIVKNATQTTVEEFTAHFPHTTRLKESKTTYYKSIYNNITIFLVVRDGTIITAKTEQDNEVAGQLRYFTGNRTNYQEKLAWNGKGGNYERAKF